MGEGMNIIEFAQKVSPVPLNMFRCKILEEYEKAERSGIPLTVCYPARVGRGAILKIIEEWKHREIE